VPRDRAAVEEAARLARAEASRLLGYLGNAERVLGRGEAAVAAFSESLRLAQGARARTVASIRLGEALRCADRPEEAERVLREALAGAEPGLRDFALQHLGKTLLDAGRRDEAAECLREALTLRREKGDEALVASTEAALRLAQAH
jgi:tetratricopeptide (TPR) repeat protein